MKSAVKCQQSKLEKVIITNNAINGWMHHKKLHIIATSMFSAVNTSKHSLWLCFKHLSSFLILRLGLLTMTTPCQYEQEQMSANEMLSDDDNVNSKLVYLQGA